MTKFLEEFKAFAMRGNVVDLAVAVVIGAAFGKIVSSLVDTIIMPLVGILLGGITITGLSVTLSEVTIAYGVFLQSIIDFTIIAFAIFVAIKIMNKLDGEDEPSSDAPKKPTETELLTEIRDLLKR